MKQQELDMKATSIYTVEVGDGRKLDCEDICSELTLEMLGLKIQQDFYVFDLGGVDVVLGMEWLALYSVSFLLRPLGVREGLFLSLKRWISFKRDFRKL